MGRKVETCEEDIPGTVGGSVLAQVTLLEVEGASGAVRTPSPLSLLC